MIQLYLLYSIWCTKIIDIAISLVNLIIVIITLVSTIIIYRLLL
nr:MAG TPA: hypothetical protein [Caudoviricetes sp.]